MNLNPKNLLKYGAYYSGILLEREKDQRVRILRYHSISDHRDRNFRYLNPSIAVSPEAFERHIAFLSRSYAIITLDEVAAWLNGGMSLQRKSVVITFDDGYRDNYRHAFPTLKKYRAPATFYVVTDAIGNADPLWTSELRYIFHRARQSRVTLSFLDCAPIELSDETVKTETAQAIANIMRRSDRKTRAEILRETRTKLAVETNGFLQQLMMSWDELREMKGQGMCIGSHTISHPLLPEISQEEAIVELTSSKSVIEQELDAPVRHFAYPNPGGSVHVNHAVKTLVLRAGYVTARTSSKGSVYHDSDPLELKGISTDNRCDHPALLAWMLNGAVDSFRSSLTKFTGSSQQGQLQ